MIKMYDSNVPAINWLNFADLLQHYDKLSDYLMIVNITNTKMTFFIFATSINLELTDSYRSQPHALVYLIKTQ